MTVLEPRVDLAVARPARAAAAVAAGIELVSTDVFDTLLLRTLRSERTRIVDGEHRFGEVLRLSGWDLPSRLLVDARLDAQRLAFRALDVGAVRSEVRLTDIVARQLRILGLPDSFVADRVGIEVAVEMESLRPNLALVAELRALRRDGLCVVAISDTTLDAGSLRWLVTHFCGPDLLDAIYSSADEGVTKRDGGLFQAIARRHGTVTERMLHIGDDPRADVRVPAGLGIAVHPLTRPRHLRLLRAANGAAARLPLALARAARHVSSQPGAADDPFTFGREVFGPIITQFCLMIWLYADQAARTDAVVLLFCARGGIGIREAFERVAARLNLPLPVRRETIMISRLVAVRVALMARSPAATEEIAREFRGESFARVAEALGGKRYALPAAWSEPFDPGAFDALLFADGGAEVRADIVRQNALFGRHLDAVAGGATRLILCDTGLYGSTQRLLAAGMPDRRIESVLFARSNYKRHGEEHFPKVTGLLVEHGFYNPLDRRTAVLRFWHVIESLFEPAVPSVRTFDEGPGGVVSNAGEVRYGRVDAAAGNELLGGALAYIDALPPEGRVALAAAAPAWRWLARTITRPGEAALRALPLGARSMDFGRAQSVPVVHDPAARRSLVRWRSVRAQLWREGAIAKAFPILKHALLPLVGSLHTARGILLRLNAGRTQRS